MLEQALDDSWKAVQQLLSLRLKYVLLGGESLQGPLPFNALCVQF